MACDTYTNELKILSIGNSFSQDTMEYVAPIALNARLSKIKLGNLYMGGCSINQHYNHAVHNLAPYTYFQNNGNGWSATENTAIERVLQAERWDWVCIQHGTGDGSRHTDENSYSNLTPFLDYLQQRLSPYTKIAYNVTWVGEPDHPHPEMLLHGKDQRLLFTKILTTIEKIVTPIATIDKIIPTGTAVQNARLKTAELLTRDGYHLTLDKGRYLAGLTFFTTLTGIPVDTITWSPPNVDNTFQTLAIGAVQNAVQKPFAITE